MILVILAHIYTELLFQKMFDVFYYTTMDLYTL